jgi:hypothetical protein
LFLVGEAVRLRSISGLFVLVAIFLGACGTVPPHESLPISARDQITSTETVVPIRQREIYIYVPPSTGGATAGASLGLVGALVGVAIDASIDSVRTSKAEAAVKPLRDALVDYDFDKAILVDLEASLPGIAWMHSDRIRVAKEATAESAAMALSNSRSSAVLFLTTDYHLTNDGDELEVTLQASLFPNSDALRAIKSLKAKDAKKVTTENSLYHNTLAFKETVANWTAASNRAENISTWDASSAAATRASLTLASKQLSQMLVADLQGQEDSVAASGGTANVDGKTGDIIMKDSGGSLIRFKDGTLLYAAKSSL